MFPGGEHGVEGGALGARAQAADAVHARAHVDIAALGLHGGPHLSGVDKGRHLALVEHGAGGAQEFIPTVVHAFSPVSHPL